MKEIMAKMVTLVTLTASCMLASLVPIGVIPSSGNGLGSVDSVVTFQNTGTEFGCIGNVGGSQAEGSAQCLGGIVPPGGVTHEQTASGNSIYTATGLGISSVGANTFANVILVFNGNEGGGPGAPFSLDQLSLNLFTAGGTPLGAFSLESAFAANALPGFGNAGFGFQLDAAQSAIANAILELNPTLVIGASAAVSGANAGPDTVFISRLDSIQAPVNDPGEVPEPTSVLLVAGGLVGLGLLRRKNKV